MYCCTRVWHAYYGQFANSALHLNRSIFLRAGFQISLSNFLISWAGQGRPVSQHDEKPSKCTHTPVFLSWYCFVYTKWFAMLFAQSICSRVSVRLREGNHFSCLREEILWECLRTPPTLCLGLVLALGLMFTDGERRLEWISGQGERWGGSAWPPSTVSKCKCM